MGIRDRTRRLEKRAGLDKDGPCPECGGQIIFAENRPNGVVEYPMGGPCSTCGNRSASGAVGLIEIVLTADGTAEKTRRGADHVWP